MTPQALIDLTGDNVGRTAVQLRLPKLLHSKAPSREQRSSTSRSAATNSSSTTEGNGPRFDVPTVNVKKQTSIRDLVQPRKPLQVTRPHATPSNTTSNPSQLVPKPRAPNIQTTLLQHLKPRPITKESGPELESESDSEEHVDSANEDNDLQPVLQTAEASPHDVRQALVAPNDGLRAVIAVSRLSSGTQDEQKIERLNRRNQSLSEFAMIVHKARHPQCQCTPEEYKIFLNGMSSNTNPTPEAGDNSQLGSLTQILHNLAVMPDTGNVIVIVSTADGLWTNVYGFARFFAPFASCNISYLVYDGNQRYRCFTISEILIAIKEVLEQRGNGPASDLVKQWIQISFAKLFQQQGNQSVKNIVMQQRNTTVIDATLDSCPSLHMDAGTRVVRLSRSSGNDFHPLYVMLEEQRTTCQKHMGKLVCPDKSCDLTFWTLEEIVAHLISDIMGMQQSERQCPLCPSEFAKWTFVFSIDGIYHILRHLSPAIPLLAESSTRRKYQCPHCFILCGSRGHVQRHIENVHVRALEIRTAAVASGEISAAEASLNDDILTRNLAFRNNFEIAALPEPLRAVARSPGFITAQMSWTTASSFSPEYVATGYPLPDVPPFTAGASSTTVSATATSPYRFIPTQQAWYLRYSADKGTSNLKQAIILTKGSGGILCPLQAEWGICGCNKYFATAKELVLHLWQALKNAQDATKRRCPWCQRLDVIFKPQAKARRRLSGKKAGKSRGIPNSSGNDRRHLLRHFPPDLKCRQCDHVSRTSNDMWTHVYAMHLKWACEVGDCMELFETQEELDHHEAEKH